jgi:hypothetical protein
MQRPVLLRGRRRCNSRRPGYGPRPDDALERDHAPVDLRLVELPGLTLNVLEQVLLLEDGNVLRLALDVDPGERHRQDSVDPPNGITSLLREPVLQLHGLCANGADGADAFAVAQHLVGSRVIWPRQFLVWMCDPADDISDGDVVDAPLGEFRYTAQSI